MQAPAKRRDLVTALQRAVIVALPLLLLSACEPAHSVELQRESAADNAAEAPPSPAGAAKRAAQSSAPHWYQEARSAAQAGDYRQSMFYLNTAASLGFAEFAALVHEPLFRPLYGTGRWQMVTDRIASNERSAATKLDSEPIADEPGKTTLCSLRLALRALPKGDS